MFRYIYIFIFRWLETCVKVNSWLRWQRQWATGVVVIIIIIRYTDLLRLITVYRVPWCAYTAVHQEGTGVRAGRTTGTVDTVPLSPPPPAVYDGDDSNRGSVPNFRVVFCTRAKVSVVFDLSPYEKR